MFLLGFDKENLPSNEYKRKLYPNFDISKLHESTAYVSEYDDCERPIKEFYETFKKNHDILKNNCNHNNGPKCCRDVNYYIDLLTGIIKESSLEYGDKKKLIKHLEDFWEPTLRAKNIYTCERETDKDSSRKRCILQHLYDLKEDEKSILSFPEKYKNYLSEKWKNIISYTDAKAATLYIKIENNSMGIIENYANFLDSSDYICDNNLDELSTDDITISTDVNSFINTISLNRISPNLGKRICYNKPYVDMLKYKASNIQRINNALSIGIALLGFFLILIFLYEFSPLRNRLRRYTKKKIEVDENVKDEMPQLYENSENGRPYISYNIVSH
ncbi:hypothetical protein POVWA1_080140 [Plasmodium ovale wallikeri]|uniref:PIR Superfamily Protein n=1 Tax=Plasmodium ovale wallikeri TaxID=864142 RepID=A0A1A9AKF9_PLAOA|nr:hypothetical protein POVWA1_080140 [Plasmodium ovale wallikeri]